MKHAVPRSLFRRAKKATVCIRQAYKLKEGSLILSHRLREYCCCSLLMLDAYLSRTDDEGYP